MSKHDEHEAEPTEDGDAAEADVEAHGLREAAVTGMSAAALIAGAGAGSALAANAPEHASAAAKQAVHKIDATHKIAATNKTAALKSHAVHKDATWKGNAVSKGSVDPSSRQGRSET